MKKSFFILFLLFISLTGYTQSLADLDRNPSFKGITIGEPICEYSNILRYAGSKTGNGKTAYSITDPKYLSIFNIKMEEGVVFEKNGRVDAIMLSKEYSPGIYNANELLTLLSSISSKYGSPNVSLDDCSGNPCVSGVRWEAINAIIDIVYLFYGTMEPGSCLYYMLYQRNDDY